jgi:hypothetical protein
VNRLDARHIAAQHSAEIVQKLRLDAVALRERAETLECGAERGFVPMSVICAALVTKWGRICLSLIAWRTWWYRMCT